MHPKVSPVDAQRKDGRPWATDPGSILANQPPTVVASAVATVLTNADVPYLSLQIGPAVASRLYINYHTRFSFGAALGAPNTQVIRAAVFVNGIRKDESIGNWYSDAGTIGRFMISGMTLPVEIRGGERTIVDLSLVHLNKGLVGVTCLSGTLSATIWPL